MTINARRLPAAVFQAVSARTGQVAGVEPYGIRNAESQPLMAGDETYIRVAGQCTNLYRAIDSAGSTIDFLLSPYRALIAAKSFSSLRSRRQVVFSPASSMWTDTQRTRSRSNN
jgi:transposase-like protein